jgi:hypothetical protein
MKKNHLRILCFVRLFCAQGYVRLSTVRQGSIPLIPVKTWPTIKKELIQTTKRTESLLRTSQLAPKQPAIVT